ncbi:MAG: PQQ-dependent sugar dehydrogenase [Candidatus Cyclobacteriaceae bacterium M2_1C_046]
MKILCSIIVSTFLAFHLFPPKALGGQLPDGFIETLIAQNLDPVSMAIAPDGRIFIAEKNGTILIVRDDKLLEDPFLTLEVDNYNERGIAGIAFHPDFELNNLFYVYYTVAGANHNRVSRFTANGDYSIPGSEEVLLDLDILSGTIHNGGAMNFAPDGTLYIAVGDGARAENSQEKTTLLGKILRINDDGSIPEDNPFYNELEGKYRSIYAMGLRNPFTFDIHSSSGKIFTTDVGQADFEEINEIIAGGNYGWPIIEGYISNQTPPENYQDPVYAYSHDIGCAAVGAAFYDPEVFAFPSEYHNMFFFGDYCGGYIKMLDPESYKVKGIFASSIDRPLSFLVDSEGSFYYLDRAGIGGGSEQDNTSTTNGKLWKVEYTGSGAPYISKNPDPKLITVGESATFEVKASGAGTLEYQWLKDNATITGANQSVYTLENVTLLENGAQFSCIVSNLEGSDTSATATLTVSDGNRPEPVIQFPEDGATYRAGTTITFKGEATDPEDGQLSEANLAWFIDFHHMDHTHPAMPPVDSVAEGSFTIPTVGEVDDNVWYRVYLIATDSEGLTQTTFKDIIPEKTIISLHTEPAGLSLNLDGKKIVAPHENLSVIGVLRTVVAPEIQEYNGNLYMFDKWLEVNDGSTVQFHAPDSTVMLTAIYNRIPIGSGIGLRGYYYNTNTPDFESSPIFNRIDSEINFEWHGGSPSTDNLGDDFYTIRWLGEIQPYFSDTYTFTTLSDDGVRLWINNELIIDKWIPQGPTEWSGSIILEEGKTYPVKLEYFEEAGGAVVKLFWSTSKLQRAIVPQSQLHPVLINSLIKGISNKIVIYPNPGKDEIFIKFPDEKFASDIQQIRILTPEGKILSAIPFVILDKKVLKVNVQHISQGIYLLHLTGKKNSVLLKIIKD